MKPTPGYLFLMVALGHQGNSNTATREHIALSLFMFPCYYVLAIFLVKGKGNQTIDHGGRNYIETINFQRTEYLNKL